MKCTRCAHEIGIGQTACGQCGAARPRLQAAFARAETAYADLRRRFDAGALPAAQFKAAVEAQMVDDGDRYWMLGVESGKWYVHDGKAWGIADPPLDETAKVAKLASAAKLANAGKNANTADVGNADGVASPNEDRCDDG